METVSAAQNGVFHGDKSSLTADSIPLSVPHMTGEEQKYIRAAFETNWITPAGPNVDAFEGEMGRFLNVGAAAALSSGTAAIHLALKLLGVAEGDHVICSSFTFGASAMPILYQGARPVFIDSELDTWNMSPAALEQALVTCASKGCMPKAAIIVNVFGQSADMEPLSELCRRYEVPIIEDAAESLGALYKGKQSGTFGAIGVLSFNGNKIITTSGGGMLVSDNLEFVKHAKFLSTQAKDPAPYYSHSTIGYNYRLSNVLAGIGRGQLEVLPDRIKARRDVFQRYYERLGDIKGLSWMLEPKGFFSTRWLSVCLLDPNVLSVTPLELVEKLKRRNIEARLCFRPMHLQQVFANCDFFAHNPAQKPVCERLFDEGLCLPSGSQMTIEQQDRVIDCIRKALLGD